MTDSFFAILDGEAGAFGVTFPDLPACVAMGDTRETAIVNAVDALRDWAQATVAAGGDVPPARSLAELMRDPAAREVIVAGLDVVSIPLITETGRTAKANLSLDSGVLAALDAVAGRVGLTRSGLVEVLARRHLHEFS